MQGFSQNSPFTLEADWPARGVVGPMWRPGCSHLKPASPRAGFLSYALLPSVPLSPQCLCGCTVPASQQDSVPIMSEGVAEGVYPHPE